MPSAPRPVRLLTTDQLSEPSLLAHGSPTRAYLRHGIAAGNTPAIRNVATQMLALDTGTQLFPVSVNTGRERLDNCYVVSPLTAYTGYARAELDRLQRPWIARPLHPLVSLVGRYLERGQIDQLVQVNNWLLSTNLYPPDWHGHELPEVTDLLANTFPEHAIGFRSLNHFSNPQLLHRLHSLGYVPIPSRQVYLFDARAGEQAAFLRHHNTRMDATLLARTPYRLVKGSDLNRAAFDRLEHLYNLLYLDKYSQLNPQFSADWMFAGQRDGWLELHALRTPEGRIDGVLGWFSHAGTLTAPVVGYDTALPQSWGLYRLLTQLCLQEAVRRRAVLNFSSGASHFKRLRGGQPEIEYSMVYVKHLPKDRQRVWHVLSVVLRSVGVPLMRRLKL